VVVGYVVRPEHIHLLRTESERHQGELDRNQVMLDVGIIADEADRQLEEAVGGFMAARAAA
jgi:hypothetical protein